MKLTIDVDGEPITVELPIEVVEALTSIAARNGLTLEQAIGQAVVNEKLLEDQVDDGGELLIKKGRKVRRLEYA